VFSFPNTSKLIFCLISNTLPDSDHIVRIRNDLQSQDSFIQMLAKHEKLTIKRFEESREILFVKKYIHQTPTSMFDIHAFHDFWEVWVRTDIVNGKPLTSYLVRLGLIKDTNAESFFSNQCNSGFCKSFMIFMVGTYNKMFDWGIFNPIRLNITEINETSSVSRKRIALNEWNEIANKIHKREVGISFLNFRKHNQRMNFIQKSVRFEFSPNFLSNYL
jgi:hypothetical protein